MKPALYSTAAIICLAVCGTAAAVQVFAQVDTGRDIYAGEPFRYNIVIDGYNRPGEVDVSPLSQFNPQSTGGRDVSQTSISIVNGKTTRSRTERYVMGYTLTARKAGRVTLPPVSVQVEGRTYRTDPVTINVIQPGKAEQVDLEMELSCRKCYVGQSLTMTVRFYYWAKVGRPQFDIPVFSDDAFDFGDPDIIDSGQQQYDLAGRSVLVSQGMAEHDGRNCNVITITKLLIPARSGHFTLEPVTVSVDVAVGRTGWGLFGDYEYKRFAATSDPAELEVIPLPQKGKPDDFYGLVGNYTIQAEAWPTEVSVGDPITVTIRVGGQRYLSPVRWPRLEAIPDMAANFKIPSQRSLPRIEDGYKVFTQTVRATNDRVAAIPAIGISFFDPIAGTYRTARTDPIRLTVAGAKILTGADAEGRGPSTAANSYVETVKSGISANYEGADALEDVAFHPLAALTSPAYAAAWGLPLAAVVVSALTRLFTGTSAARRDVKRRRNACRMAIRRLRRTAASGAEQRGVLIADALRQFIADRFDRVAGSLTAGDCRETIASRTGDSDLASDYAAIIETCEAVRYASSVGNVASDRTAAAIDLVRRVEKAALVFTTRSGKRTQVFHAVLTGLLLSGAWAPVEAVLSRDEMTELFTRANQAFRQANIQAAKDTEQGLELRKKAILYFDRLIQEGNIRNPKLYYNLGNAYLLNGDIGRAILNYRKAEELDGSDQNIQKNLAFARSRAIDLFAVPPQKRVFQTLFFWHYDFTAATRFFTAWVSFVTACLLGVLMIWKGRSASGTAVLLVAAVVCVCMLTSVFAEAWKDAHTAQGVIIAGEVSARQGDGEVYPPSFKEPLHAGTEFELLKKRSGWVHIRLANGSDTWVPEDAVGLVRI